MEGNVITAEERKERREMNRWLAEHLFGWSDFASCGSHYIGFDPDFKPPSTRNLKEGGEIRVRRSVPDYVEHWVIIAEQMRAKGWEWRVEGVPDDELRDEVERFSAEFARKGYGPADATGYAYEATTIGEAVTAAARAALEAKCQ